jgi:hypothetical protein
LLGVEQVGLGSIEVGLVLELDLLGHGVGLSQGEGSLERGFGQIDDGDDGEVGGLGGGDVGGIDDGQEVAGFVDLAFVDVDLSNDSGDARAHFGIGIGVVIDFARAGEMGAPAA